MDPLYTLIKRCWYYVLIIMNQGTKEINNLVSKVVMLIHIIVHREIKSKIFVLE